MNSLVKMIKSLSLSLSVAAIMILVALLIFSRECKRSNICPPVGYVLVTQGFIDTLILVANIPPDTVYDTTIIKGDIVYVDKKVPVPVHIDPETNFYSDSIVNDKISIWMDITVKGYMTEWNWEYEPVVVEKETIITKYKLKPVSYETVISKSGVYASLGVGGNQSAFILSGSIDLINRRDKLYGLQYIRFDEQNYYLFRLGTKLKLRR